VEGALASLALDPQIGIVLLVDTHFLLSLYVDLLLFRLAALAQDFSIVCKHVFTSQASFLNNCKLAECTSSGHLWHKNVAGMLTLE
jgi:hypothetical protein